MRLGVVLPSPTRVGWPEAARIAAEADAAGLDAVLVEAEPGRDALMVASSLAARTRTLRVAAEVAVGQHPVHLAERVAVADQCLAGRLVLVLRSDAACGAELGETREILSLALSSRPFRYSGQRWTVPARLPENDGAGWSHVRVTPSPAQFILPIWTSRSGHASEFILLDWICDARGERDMESTAASIRRLSGQGQAGVAFVDGVEDRVEHGRDAAPHAHRLQSHGAGGGGGFCLLVPALP